MLIISIAIGFALAIMELVFSYALQAFLTVMGIAAIGSMRIPQWLPHDTLSQVIKVLVIGAIVRAGLQWAQEYLRGTTYEQFRYLMRSRLIKSTLASASASSSEVMSMFNEKINLAANVVMGIQVTLLQTAVNILLFASMFLLSPLLTLLLVGASIIVYLPMRLFNRQVRQAGSVLTVEDENITRRMLMSIKNLLFLRIYGLTDREENQTQKSLLRLHSALVSFYKGVGFLVAFPQIFGITLICAATIYGSKMSFLRPGEMLSFFYLFIKFSQSISVTTSSFSKITFHFSQMQQVYQWWSKTEDDTTLKERDTPLASLGSASLTDGPIGWKLQNIEFQYPQAEAQVLVGLNLEIRPGSTLVITGPSGGGKSTLLNLLLGELAPNKGHIDVLINDRFQSLQTVRRQLLKNIGYVGPESFLIDGTVLQNLLYGLEGIPNQEEIKTALLKAECHFVFDQEKGLNHMITEQGQGLSAGQKQRLGLARALLRKPRALILDEATANLDEGTEKKLLETLSRLKGETTIVAVTHRQTMLTIADQHLTLG